MAIRPDYRSNTGAPSWTRVATADAAAVDAGLRAHMLRVYNWMASGLVLTGIVAYLIASVPELQELFWQVGAMPPATAPSHPPSSAGPRSCPRSPSCWC